MSHFSKEEFANYDSNRVTVSGEAHSEKASEAKKVVIANPNFKKASEAFQLFTMGYLNAETPGNIEYVAKAAINKNVISRPNGDPDFMLLDAINSVEVWTEDPKVLKDMSKEDKMLSLSTDLREFRFIMNLLTTDLILDREDALSIVKEVSSFDNNKDAKKFIMEEFTHTLYASDTFQDTSTTFQENLRSLLSDAQSSDYKNANYIFMAAGNKNVIEREDLSVFSSIEKAHYFLNTDLSWQEGLEKEQIKEVLRHELDNFDLIMTTLTGEQVLDRNDASAIITSTFTCHTSDEALAYATNASSHVNSEEAMIDAMVTEATAPQVENSSFSK